MLHKLFIKLSRIAMIIGLCVVMLGAYVRLSDAGLGCPDWPGCYGKLLGVPDTAREIRQAEQDYPQSRFSPDKAWKEVLHRYLAGIFSLLILLITVIAVKNRSHPQQPLVIPLVLSGLMVAQIVLGMWTVTMLLKPVVVSAHLLCGLAILSLLWYLAMPARYSDNVSAELSARRLWRHASLIGIGVLVIQITSGVWTSSNYAALACTDFPTCQQEWWPPMDFSSGFQIVQKANGGSYEYGVLDSAARTTIHMAHRSGALLTLLLLGGFLLALLSNRPPLLLATVAKVSLVLLALQVLLGVFNVVLSLPLPIATAHTGVATVLLLSLVTLNRMLKS